MQTVWDKIRTSQSVHQCLPCQVLSVCPRSPAERQASLSQLVVPAAPSSFYHFIAQLDKSSPVPDQRAAPPHWESYDPHWLWDHVHNARTERFTQSPASCLRFHLASLRPRGRAEGPSADMGSIRAPEINAEKLFIIVIYFLLFDRKNCLCTSPK